MSLVWTVYPLKPPPSVMIQHLSQSGALAQTVIALTVTFEETPRVSLSKLPRTGPHL